MPVDNRCRRCGGDDCPDPFCECPCHVAAEQLEQIHRTYDADELGIDQEDD